MIFVCSNFPSSSLYLIYRCYSNSGFTFLFWCLMLRLAPSLCHRPPFPSSSQPPLWFALDPQYQSIFSWCVATEILFLISGPTAEYKAHEIEGFGFHAGHTHRRLANTCRVSGSFELMVLGAETLCPHSLLELPANENVRHDEREARSCVTWALPVAGNGLLVLRNLALLGFELHRFLCTCEGSRFLTLVLLSFLGMVQVHLLSWYDIY